MSVSKEFMLIFMLIMVVCSIGLTSAHSFAFCNPSMSHVHVLSAVGGSYIGNTATYVFHKSSCAHAKKIKNKVYFKSRIEAVDSGYRPCKHCKP